MCSNNVGISVSLSLFLCLHPSNSQLLTLFSRLALSHGEQAGFWKLHTHTQRLLSKASRKRNFCFLQGYIPMRPGKTLTGSAGLMCSQLSQLYGLGEWNTCSSWYKGQDCIKPYRTRKDVLKDKGQLARQSKFIASASHYIESPFTESFLTLQGLYIYCSLFLQ